MVASRELIELEAAEVERDLADLDVSMVAATAVVSLQKRVFSSVPISRVVLEKLPANTFRRRYGLRENVQEKGRLFES